MVGILNPAILRLLCKKRSQGNSNLQCYDISQMHHYIIESETFGEAEGHLAEQGDIGQRVWTFDGAEGHLGYKKDICWHGDNISLRRRSFYGTEQKLAPQKDIRHRRSSFDNDAGHFTVPKDI
jgi:hypothetical protein